MAEHNTARKTLRAGEIVLDWIPRHWPLTPLGPYKNCYLANWQDDAKTTQDIQEEINEGRCKAVGLIAGPALDRRSGLVWVDIDGPSVQKVVEELSHVGYKDAFPDTLTVCSGRPGRERRLYSVSQKDLDSFIRNKYTWKAETRGEKLEILWDNTQGVLMGLHPETDGFYTPDGLGFEWASDLPLIPQWILNAIISKNARIGPPVKQLTRVEGPGFGFTIIKDIERDRSMALEAMWSLPSECADDYDTWIMVGQALHSVDPDLLETWEEWSQQSEKYQPGICERKWNSFRSENGIGLGSLIDLSNQHSSVIANRLAIEAASAPSDYELDDLERLRVESELALGIHEEQMVQAMVMGSISHTVQQVVEAVQDMTGDPIDVGPELTETATSIGLSPSKQYGSNRDKGKSNPPANILRDMMIKRIGHEIVCDSTEETFYRYGQKHEGLWSRMTGFEVKELIQDVLDEMNLPKGYGTGTISAMLEMLGPKLGVREWNSERDRISFRNGVLNISTMELEPHNRNDFFIHQLPFDYIPYADCPRTKQWLAETQFGDTDMVKILQAWLRAVLLGRHELQMFLELIGTGGTGKAQPIDARVLTPSGWKTMGEIKIGEKVIAADGKPAEVLGVFPQGRKTIYRLTFDDQSQCECCAEHLWSVQRGPQQPAEVLSLQEIQELRSAEPNKPIWIPTTQPVQYPAQSIEAYGDPWSVGRDLIRSTWSSIPQALLQNSMTVRLDLLRGAMDHGGVIDVMGRCMVMVHSAGVAKGLLEIIHSLGGTGIVDPVIDAVAPDDTILLSHRVLYKLPCTLCPVKRNRMLMRSWKNHCQFDGHRLLISVEEVGEKEAQCIYIDHPDHLYITNDYIVTHNTTFSNLCIALVGKENTFSTRLNMLEGNRFEVAGAYNKRLVVIGDADRYGGNVEVLKQLTGGDQIRLEMKFQNQSGSGFVYRGLVMATANESIQTTDLTGGLFRRRLTVPFTRSRRYRNGVDRTMIDIDESGNPYGYLAEELAGVVNWCLSMSEQEMINYTKDAVEHVPSLRRMKVEQMSESSNIIDWLKDRVVFAPSVGTPVGDRRDIIGDYYFKNAEAWLYPSYCDHCRKGNVREVGRKRFEILLDDVCKNQLGLPVRKFHNSRRSVCFKGLAIRRANDNTFDDYPSIVEYALNQEAYSTLYGEANVVRDQIESTHYSTNTDGVAEGGIEKLDLNLPF